MAKKIKYVIGIIGGNENVNTIKYVTSIDTNTNIAKWESDKEAKVFDSKSYAEDVAFGLCVNGYGAVVMIKTDYITLKNPEDYTEKFTYEDGYEDGCNSKESEVLDILSEMQSKNKFDMATIEEIKKRLGD